jgi:potassium-transporting ATPase potassium-binding subunit
MAIYDQAIQSTAVLVALFVCLAPTTIGGLLSAIGIAGMDRMVQRNVLAMSGRAIEAAGDASTLLLDKTGTITYGNRMAAGATDSALDSYTPAGGTGAFAGILPGEISPGGDGGGLYSILVLALLAVFVAGLMVGRTPEFLGKKIRAPQMKLIVTYVLTIPVTILIFAAISLVIPAGTNAILDPGFHGLSEVTYAYASVANNNGSAFAGLAANTAWYDTTLGLSMLIGRFGPIVLALAVAGSLAGARVHARTRATLDTAGPTFVAFLLGVIVIAGGLIYFPMLILGPIGERIVG